MSTPMHPLHWQHPEPEPVKSVASRGNRVPLIQNSLVVIATIAAIWSLQWAKAFFIPLAVAIFATFWLMPLVDWLQRLRIPRSLGAAVVLAATICALGGTGYALRDDARDFVSGLTSASRHARTAFDRASRDPNGWIHHLKSALADRAPPGAGGASAAETVDVETRLLRSSSAVVAVAVETTVVLFLIYLLLASGDLFKRKLVVVISGRLSRQRVTVEILHEIGVQLQRYLVVLVSTNLAIGVLTWALFAAMGVEHAAVWGVAAAVLHLIPYLGPAVIAGAVFLVTSAQFNSLSQAFMVTSVSLAITALIGMLLTTVLASRASNMNSVATFAGLMFWSWLWGIPGLLLGTPIIMATKAVADRIEGLNWLGTFLSGPPKRPRRDTASAVVTEAATCAEATPVTRELTADVVRMEARDSDRANAAHRMG
jgi:predicted PurR-regulated permease PerM